MLRYTTNLLLLQHANVNPFLPITVECRPPVLSFTGLGSCFPEYHVQAFFDSAPNNFFIKGLVVLCHSFCIFFIFLLQYIHSYNHLLTTFAEVLLHIFIAAGSAGGTFLGCRAEIRTRACHTASQRTAN